jgi:hypothetical protein
MNEFLCARETAFRRDRKLKARTRTVANYSDCAIRAKHRPKPDLNKFSASPVNTPAYFVSDRTQGSPIETLLIIAQAMRLSGLRARPAGPPFNGRTIRYCRRRHPRSVDPDSRPAMSSAL